MLLPKTGSDTCEGHGSAVLIAELLSKVLWGTLTPLLDNHLNNWSVETSSRTSLDTHTPFKPLGFGPLLLVLLPIPIHLWPIHHMDRKLTNDEAGLS